MLGVHKFDTALENGRDKEAECSKPRQVQNVDGKTYKEQTALSTLPDSDGSQISLVRFWKIVWVLHRPIPESHFHILLSKILKI